MPVKFSILPHRALILFTYSGAVGLQESLDAVAACSAHPSYSPELRQLCDLTRVTSVERNSVKLLNMQAKVAENLRPGSTDLIVLFLATTPAGQQLAQSARRSWEGLNSVIVLIHDREDEALAMLGLPERRICDLVSASAKA